MTPLCPVLVAGPSTPAPDHLAAVAELARRGHPVLAGPARGPLAAAALRAGADAVLLLDPDVGFYPDDPARLLAHGRPVILAALPDPGRRGFAADWLPGTATVRFGRAGGLVPVRAARLGLALVRRDALERVAALARPAPGPPRPGPPPDPWFGPLTVFDAGGPRTLDGDAAFCERCRLAGVPVLADTRVRAVRFAPYGYSWEDAGRDPDRVADYTFHVGDPPPAGPPPPGPAFRPPAEPLQPGFPRLAAYVVTYPANRDSLAATLASLRASDWGAEPTVIDQPADWPVGGESGPNNYRRALEAAAAGGCDFALVLEDDVRVNRHLRHNLLTNPLIARDECDYLSLFMPDLVADPWDRAEPHLGYRLARPLYTGPNAGWEKFRVWGAQAYLLSRRLVLACLDRWDALDGPQDSRVLGTCRELSVPLFYTLPCLADHAPVRSGYGTPPAYAADFDPAFRLLPGAGLHPPEAVPGWLTRAEAELLWRTAAGRDVLELGRAFGRSAVCLGQAARRVVSVDLAEPAEAAEWCRRYGVADRVEFRRGDAAEVCRDLAGERFDLGFIDTGHDAASVERDIASVLPLLAPGGVLVFHDYPDPGWPDVRRVVDAHAARRGWKRTAQAGYLGVFQT